MWQLIWAATFLQSSFWQQSEETTFLYQDSPCGRTPTGTRNRHTNTCIHTRTRVCVHTRTHTHTMMIITAPCSQPYHGAEGESRPGTKSTRQSQLITSASKWISTQAGCWRLLSLQEVRWMHAPRWRIIGCREGLVPSGARLPSNLPSGISGILLSVGRAPRHNLHIICATGWTLTHKLPAERNTKKKKTIFH